MNYSSKSLRLILAAAVLFLVVVTPLTLQHVSLQQQNFISIAAAQATATTSNSAPASTGCSATLFSWGSFFSLSCWGPLLSAVISGALVSVASWTLTAAGVLFNWALTATVFQFGALINCGLSSVGSAAGCTSSASGTGPIVAINIAWGLFRDLSNIVIIGMFTFIAIMTILGNTEYGYKKMLSRVLIVAILINFSLLFTKIIIDTSDFMATQFATAAGGQFAQAENQSSTANTASSATVSGSTVSVPAQPGIAGAFMGYAGVTGFGDTAAAVFNYGVNPEGGAWGALLFGVITALLFFAAAIVLFYGTFLLLSRALLMIFLMLTASLAFASYLLPGGSSSFGWSLWWKTLFRNAVFAPLLVVLLWITLQMAQTFKASTGSLGNLVSNPQSSLNINVLFGYLIVIGLLYISLRLSSSFASSVGGLSIAQSSWDALAHSSLAALQSQTIGRWAGGRAELQSARAQKSRERGRNNLDRDDKAARAAFGQTAMYDQSAARYRAIAKAPLKAVLETRPRVAGEARAALPAPSAENQEQMRREAQSDQRENLQRQKETMVAAAKESAAAAGKELEKSKNELAKGNPEYAQAHDDLTAAEKARDQAAKEHDEAIKELRGQFESKTSDVDRARIQKEINESAESHKSDMRERDQKIEEARVRTRQVESRSDTVLKLQKVYDQRVHELEQNQKELAEVSAAPQERVPVREAGAAQQSEHLSVRTPDSMPEAANDNEVARKSRQGGVRLRGIMTDTKGSPGSANDNNPPGGGVAA